MKITINIDESLIKRWGAIIILNPKDGPKDAGIAIPGFEYDVKGDSPTFVFDWGKQEQKLSLVDMKESGIDDLEFTGDKKQ